MWIVLIVQGVVVPTIIFPCLANSILSKEHVDILAKINIRGILHPPYRQHFPLVASYWRTCYPREYLSWIIKQIFSVWGNTECLRLQYHCRMGLIHSWYRVFKAVTFWTLIMWSNTSLMLKSGITDQHLGSLPTDHHEEFGYLLTCNSNLRWKHHL